MRLWKQAVVQGEGEGLIVRKPKTCYEHGRTNSVIKFKIHRDDEAIVATTDPHFTLLLPSGITFIAKHSDTKKEIKVGDVVSFVSNGFSSNGAPVNAKIVRIRPEFSWEEFVMSHKTERDIFDRPLSENTWWASPELTTKNEKGYWTREEGKEIYNYLLDFAHRRGFDPLVPDNWYSVTTTHIREDGGGGILNHFNGSIVNALMHSFPSIGLVKSKFKLHPKFHWHSYENRKQFFEELAKENGIDSSKASDWYKLTQAMLANKKGGTTLVQQYGSIERLLKDVYPSLNLEASQFVTIPHNRKAFFDEFAKKRKFNPLVANNWYTIGHKDIMNEKGATGMLKNFGGSFVKALSLTYPSLSLDIAKFKNLPQSFWKDHSNRKMFFDKLARKRAFNPLQKERWYPITKLDVMLEKGGLSILSYYNSSIRSALMDVYPDIDFDESKFIFVK